MTTTFAPRQQRQPQAPKKGLSGTVALVLGVILAGVVAVIFVLVALSNSNTPAPVTTTTTNPGVSVQVSPDGSSATITVPGNTTQDVWPGHPGQPLPPSALDN